MRWMLVTCVLCALVVPAIAEDGAQPAPVPAPEQQAALARIEALRTQVAALVEQGKHAQATPLAREVLSLVEGMHGREHPDVAASLTSLALLLVEQGAYLEARPLCERALAIREQAFGAEHPLVAQSLNNLAVLLKDQGAYAQARPLFERALSICERTLGGEHLDVAQSLNNLAAVLRDQGDYPGARRLQERSLAINEKALGPVHPAVGLDLNNLAWLVQTQGAHAEARLLYERALAIFEGAHGSDHPRVALTLNNLAMLLKAQGAYAEARPLYERALAIHERVLGGDHPTVATGLDNLAALLAVQGSPGEARPLFERALAIRERALGKDHPDVATSLTNLAELLRAQGAYAEARPLYVRALAIRERALGMEHSQVAYSLNNLALLYAAQGAYAAARPLYERALAIKEKALGKDHASVATSLNNLASLLHDQGALAEARPLYERALQIREKTLRKDHPAVATSLGNLAALLHAQGAYAEAKPLFERALAIQEVTFGQDHPNVAHALANLGAVLYSQRSFAEARPLFERALRIREEALGGDHPAVAASLNNLATLLRSQGADAEARPLYERALTIREKALGEGHPLVAASLDNLAVLLHVQGAHAEARPLHERALASTFGTLREQFGGLGARARLDLVRTVRSRIASWLDLAPKVGVSGYAEVVRFKGIVSRANEAERRLLRAGTVAQARLEELQAAEGAVARLAGAIPTRRGGAAGARERWQEAYARAVARREGLSQALARDFAGYRQALEGFEVGPAQIQARLGERDVLVDFLRVKDRYLAFVLRREGDAVRVDLGAASAIDEAAGALAVAIAQRREDAEVDAAGRRVADLVLVPLGGALGGGVARLVICPDAALATVPFAALPGKEAGRRLSDDLRLAFVAMAQDLVPREQVAQGAGVLALGAVDYDKAAASDGPSLEAERPVLAALSRAPRGSTFAVLPATRAEAAVPGQAIGGESVVLTDAQATEAAVRNACSGKRVLHLATHGFVREDLMQGLFTTGADKDMGLEATLERHVAGGHDPMVLAGLALAGANPREGGQGDDGVLTALEASYLELDGCELAVLSACQTALGHAEAGEGVVGLVQAFRMAGAQRVLGSLWKVDDDATRALMTEFYAHWSPKDGTPGSSAAQALRRAQETVRGQARWKHPYYWAAWVLWGAP